MDLKNALAVCLISLFSATLVVLIAKSLDSQVASRLEPQLVKIAEELETIRKQGGMAPASSAGTATPAADDALMVYYFHGVRCPTCRAAEANALATVESVYASQLAGGQVVWKVVDYEKDAAGREMAKRFDITNATIVLAKMKDGQIDDDAWKRLDRILSLATDKPGISAYLQEEIDKMLSTADEESEPEEDEDPPTIPVPDEHEDTDASTPSTDPPDIPIPE